MSRWKICQARCQVLLVTALVAPLIVANALQPGNAPITSTSGDRSDFAEVKTLPGFSGDFDSNMYSGYISLGVSSTAARSSDTKASEKHIFYLIAESEGNLQRDPVILWLTGGPGCSGLDAFIYEHGPFIFQMQERDNGHGQAGRTKAADIKLTKNPNSWTKVATVIYVDSPVGTGLSYSDHPRADYVTDDKQTVVDLYNFLQRLHDRHPNLRDRHLYIAGESYAGVYVPLLAREILDRSPHESRSSRLLLQGYLVGNAVTDEQVDGNAKVEFAYGMALISPAMYQDLHRACDSNFWNATRGSKCWRQLDAMDEAMEGVNPYSILDPCYSGTEAPVAGHVAWPLAPVLRMQAMQQPKIRSRGLKASGTMVGHAVACADRRIAMEWVNRPDVRNALHARTLDQLKWTPCSDVLDYYMAPADMVPVHKELIKQGLRVLVYTGDHDYVVPFTGTRKWIYDMGLQTDTPYKPWKMKQQVAGFYARFYPSLVFATVKGAGHMVPQTHPVQALELMRRFLAEAL